jgi:indole-3-glycerol phosphate synthase/phosphoribosylanthranilate isomerase
VLHDIVERKKLDVAARKRALAPTARLRRSLRAALARPGARFILEAKRRSPSAGDLRPALDARAIVEAYSGIADAISVVTDGPFFGGSLELLADVRARTELPLLCKDFVVDPFQVVEAAAYGADAVLLMLSILDDRSARAALAEAERLGLDALVEVHDEAELARALAMGAELVGINHRSFHDLSIDLGITARLAPRVPEGVTLVAESGIASDADVRALAPFVDAFLVGSSLMRQPSLRAAATTLVHGRVKVCGLTEPEDLALVAAHGASMGGMIFAPSPREIDRDRARALAASAPIPLVGVFRDAAPDRIVALARELELAAVQLHGSEPSATVAALRSALPRETQVIRAVAVDVDGTSPVVSDEPAADRLLFDASVAGCSGGMGIAFAWDRIAEHPRREQAILAGGLDASNVRVARAVGAWALDVSSGVEGPTRGRKSPARVAEFFDALRVPVRSEVTR